MKEKSIQIFVVIRYQNKVILINSVFRTGKNYPQVFLEECK